MGGFVLITIILVLLCASGRPAPSNNLTIGTKKSSHSHYSITPPRSGFSALMTWWREREPDRNCGQMRPLGAHLLSRAYSLATKKRDIYRTSTLDSTAGCSCPLACRFTRQCLSRYARGCTGRPPSGFRRSTVRRSGIAPTLCRCSSATSRRRTRKLERRLCWRC